eukprot:2314658-Pyramimonas_sp.AAC.2
MLLEILRRRIEEPMVRPSPPLRGGPEMYPARVWRGWYVGRPTFSGWGLTSNGRDGRANKNPFT